MASKMVITGTADTALANPHYANFERPPSISESWKVDNLAGHLRIDGRLPSQLRLAKITTGYLMTAAGSAFCRRGTGCRLRGTSPIDTHSHCSKSAPVDHEYGTIDLPLGIAL